MTVRRNQLRIVALTLVAALTCAAALANGSGQAYAAVTLLYFQGQHNGNSVLLEWATATELDTAYFYLERAYQESGPFQMLQGIGFIPSEAPPDGLSGAEYQRVDDDNVTPAEVYWYRLVEVENTQGLESRTLPIRVANEQTQPTNTATPTATSLPVTSTTPAPPQSATPSPTPTSTGTVAQTNQTETPPGTRRVTTRSTPTPVADSQLAGLVTAPPVAAENQGVADDQGQSLPTTSPEGYPGQTTGAAGLALQSDPDGYPVQPPTLPSVTIQPYPAKVGPRDLTDGDGTPVPSIGANSQATDAGQSDETSTAGNSPALGTLFLWLGFAASLIMFISAVTGAVYYFSRQRYGKH